MKASDVKPGQTFTCENETQVCQRVRLPSSWWTYAGEQDFVPVVQSDTGRLDGVVKSVTVQLVSPPTVRLDTLEPGDRFTSLFSDTVYMVLEDLDGAYEHLIMVTSDGSYQVDSREPDTEVIKITK